MDHHEPVTDPAEAFEALRAEVAALRLAPDYSLDLARLAKGIADMSSQLKAMREHPAFQAQQYQEAVANQAREAAQKFAQAMQRDRAQLAELMARKKNTQRLIYCDAAALVLGILLAPLLASALPFGLDSRIAALIMQTDRWKAGEALMQAADPQNWQQVVEASKFMRDNQKEIEACRARAVKSQKAHRCMISIDQ